MASRAKAALRRQWLTVMGLVCCLVYSSAELRKAPSGKVMPHTARLDCGKVMIDICSDSHVACFDSMVQDIGVDILFCIAEKKPLMIN